jgi:hypothetical protein
MDSLDEDEFLVFLSQAAELVPKPFAPCGPLQDLAGH